MFNKEFYPTPKNVIKLMLEGVDIENKIVLEPSAGKGDIIDYLKENGAKEVLSYEKNKDLAVIVKMKSRFLGYDFFECLDVQISHINIIVMNPPFSNAVDHILHAWKIAPEGCEIIALCNWQTLDNLKSRKFHQLESLISSFGYSQKLGNVFVEAERKTEVETGLVRLFKPILSSDFDYNGFDIEEEPESVGGSSIMQYNEIRDIVGRYRGALKHFDSVYAVTSEMTELIKGIGLTCKVDFISSYDDRATDKTQFAKVLQKQAWKSIFNKLNIEKYVTRRVISEINRFVEIQTRFPFTVKNIYKMLEIIAGTREQTMNKSLCEAVDNFTRYTHDNRFFVEGWKTNAGHLLNKKIIIPYMVRKSYSGLALDYCSSQNQQDLLDLVKVLCFLTNTNFSDIPCLRNMLREKFIESNTWYNWGFFRIKGFKKGTLHIQFLNVKHWENLNRRYAEIKGQVLPEKI